MKQAGTVRPEVQLDALVRMAYEDEPPRRISAKQMSQVLTCAGVGIGGFLSLSPLTLSAVDVETFQLLIRDAVTAIVETGAWRPGLQLQVGIYLFRRPEDGHVQRFFDARPTHDWSAVALFILSALLERVGDKLRRCPSCSKIFVRIGRRDYCSTACSQRCRSAKHYRAQRETILNRRAQSRIDQMKPRRVQSRRLQRIATEGLTGGNRTPQVRVTPTKNARHSTRGKSGR